MDNYIGVDISLNSTAVYIESNKGVNILSFTNKKDTNKYIKELETYGVKFFHLLNEKSDNYSENEILQLKKYDFIATEMIKSILSCIDLKQKTKCVIEGFSFSKNTQSILNIVELSTLIRLNILKEIDGVDIKIISPKSLKVEACKMCYEPINIGIKKQKYKYCNHQGITGGNFKKPEMYRAVIEGQIDTPLLQMFETYKDLMNRDKIPNPIEDIIDAMFACKVAKQN